MRNNSHEVISFNYKFFDRSELENFRSTQSTVVYEVFRLINGIPLFWEGHWRRLQNSLVGIKPPFEIQKTKLEKHLRDFISQNPCLNANIRIELFDQNILIYVVWVEYPSTMEYKQGVRVDYTETIRVNPTRKIFRPIWKKNIEKKISSAGVFESLLINAQGNITEGSHTNVLFIRDHTLFSAEESLILPGITREEVLKLASRLNIQLEYKSLKKEMLTSFDAAFLCATSLQILPISEINGQLFNVNNDILRKLMYAFEKHIEQELKMEIQKWR